MALTSQITTSLLQVDGRMTEGGVIEIVPGARLLLDVGVEDIEPGALLDEIATAVAEAKAARDEAVDISGISTTDAAVAGRITTPGSQTQTALSATYAAVRTFDVKAYGALGNGVADDRAAIQAAITACENAGGGRVFIPAGTYKLNSGGGLKFTPNTGSRGWVIVEFAPGAKFVLTSNCRRAFDFERTADYDWFRRIRIERAEIDCGNVVGSAGEAVIGSWIAGVHQQRLNFEDIDIIEPHIYNLPAEQPTRARAHIWIDSNEPSPYPGPTTCYMRRINVIRPRLYGGDVGVSVCFSPAIASSGTGTNAWIEDVLVEDATVELNGAAPTTLKSQSGVIVGGSALGDNVKIIRPKVKWSGDIGIEVNGIREVVVEDPYTEDCKIGVYFNNFHPLPDVDRQTLTVTNPTHVVTAAWVAGYSNGIKLGPAGPFGRLVARDVTYICDDALWSQWNTSGVGFIGMAIPVLADVREVDIDGFKGRVTAATFDATVATPISLIDLASTYVGAIMRVRNADGYLEVNRTGAGAANTRVFAFRATDAVLHADALSWQIVGTGLTNFTQHGVAVGESTSGIATSQFRGRIRGAVGRSVTGDTGPCGVRFFAGATAGSVIKGTGFEVSGCDFSALAGTSAEDVKTADAATMAKLKLLGNTYRSTSSRPGQGSATWDPPSTATGGIASTTVSLTGASVGDAVIAWLPQVMPAGVFLVANVTAADTVTVTLINMSGATVDLASNTLRVQRIANIA